MQQYTSCISPMIADRSFLFCLELIPQFLQVSNFLSPSWFRCCMIKLGLSTSSILVLYHFLNNLSHWQIKSILFVITVLMIFIFCWLNEIETYDIYLKDKQLNKLSYGWRVIGLNLTYSRNFMSLIIWDGSIFTSMI